MRLDTATIHAILVAFNEGKAKSAIAAEFGVDPSTVRYHIKAFEQAYGSTDAVYAMIRRVQKQCDHPSLKCLICGQAHDNIKRRELEEIQLLKTRLEIATEVLKRYGYNME